MPFQVQIIGSAPSAERKIYNINDPDLIAPWFQGGQSVLHVKSCGSQLAVIAQLIMIFVGHPYFTNVACHYGNDSPIYLFILDMSLFHTHYM